MLQNILKLKEEIVELLRKLGFSKPIIRKDSIAIYNKQDLVKFAREIRFVDGVKVSSNKIWSGRSKNDVLDLLVESFNVAQRDFDNLKSKEKIIGFLKNMVKR